MTELEGRDGRFEVRFTRGALDDLVRLHEYLLERATTVDELELATQAVAEIEIACRAQLARTPMLYRRSDRGDAGIHRRERRELVIPFGSTGYVALFDIEPGRIVLVTHVRHQREEDYD